MDQVGDKVNLLEYWNSYIVSSQL